MRKLIALAILILAISPVHATGPICERPEVIKEAINIAICTHLFNCKALKYENYEQIQNSTPEEIVTQFEDTHQIILETASRLHQLNMPAGVEFMRQIGLITRDGMVGLRTFVKSSTAVTTDYDSVWESSTCKAKFTVDPEAQKAVLLWHNLLKVRGEPDMMLISESAASNRDIEIISKMVLTKTQADTDANLQKAVNEFTFTAQPRLTYNSFTSGYIITVK